MLPQNTHKPTNTTAFRHRNERHIPCTADVGELTSCSTNRSTGYQVYSIKLGWHKPPSCRCVFLDGGNPVAHRCLSLAVWSLDPRKHNARICLLEGLMAMLKPNVAFLQSLASNTAAQSSSLGNGNCCKGTTSDIEHSH